MKYSFHNHREWVTYFKYHCGMVQYHCGFRPSDLSLKTRKRNIFDHDSILIQGQFENTTSICALCNHNNYPSNSLKTFPEYLTFNLWFSKPDFLKIDQISGSSNSIPDTTKQINRTVTSTRWKPRILYIPIQVTFMTFLSS